MKKIGYILSGITLIIVILFFVRQFIVHQENKKMQIRGNELVKAIEKFKIERDRLPASLSEMGLKESESEGPYYVRLDSIDYKVTFEIGFDNDEYAYVSNTKQWKYER